MRAFEEVIRGPGGIAEAARPGVAVIEASTLPIDVKEGARRLLGGRGATLLDCPVSGTGAQLRARDVIVCASGDAAAWPVPLQAANAAALAAARDPAQLKVVIEVAG